MNKWLVGAAAAAALAALPGCGLVGKDHGKGHGKEAAHGAMPATHGLPSKAEIASLFDEWNATLQTGGPNDMALLYAEDGVLLPTVSNDVRSNRPEIAEYFEHFLQLHPRGVINEQHIDVLDYNTAVNSGVYTFDLVRDGAPTYVVARYNFIYEKVGPRWLIKSHHSSAMPEAVTERPQTLAQRLGQPSPRAEAPTAADEGHGDDGHADKGHGDKGHGEKTAEAKKVEHGGHGGGH